MLSTQVVLVNLRKGSAVPGNYGLYAIAIVTAYRSVPSLTVNRARERISKEMSFTNLQRIV